MKQILSDTDRTLLDKRIADAEKQTKAQIVLATINRSDNYTEIPWKAFAIGSSIAGFFVFLLHLLKPGWVTDAVILSSIVIILATGIFFALLTLSFPVIARLFLSGNRKETETRQYAESLFLSRELYSTGSRRSILLLLSLFERQVIILPDKGVGEQLSIDVMVDIISKMTQYLKQNEVRNALEAGLDELITALCPAPSGGQDKNELSDKIIEEEGA